MCPCHPLAVHSLVQTGPRQRCPPRGGPSLQGLLGCPLPPGAAHPRAACSPPRSSSGSGVLPQTSDTFRPCDLIFPRPPKPSGWQAPRVLPSGPGAGDQPGFLSCGTGGAEVPVGRGGVGTPCCCTAASAHPHHVGTRCADLEAQSGRARWRRSLGRGGRDQVRSQAGPNWKFHWADRPTARKAKATQTDQPCPQELTVPWGVGDGQVI